MTTPQKNQIKDVSFSTGNRAQHHSIKDIFSLTSSRNHANAEPFFGHPSPNVKYTGKRYNST